MTTLQKGHQMTRGTLMVLKRLIVTTLGALGLGALLATGPVLADVPPPEDLAAPGTPPPETDACTAVMELADTAAVADTVDVSVCVDDMAAIAQPVVDLRAAQLAVDAAQTVADSAEDALDTAKEGNDQAAITTAQNAFDAANIRLDAAKAARDKIAADSSVAQAALDELNAIQLITATAMAQTTAESVRDATQASLNALQFDSDGNNVNTGGTALSTLQSTYDSAVSDWEALAADATDATKAPIAQRVVDSKHALDAAKRDAAYMALKATLDAQTQAAKDATTAAENAVKAKAAAGKAIVTGLMGTPAPVTANDDTTMRIARIVADLQNKHAAAVKDRDAKDALVNGTGGTAEKKTEADTNLANANTRLANARTAYNEAAETIADDGTRPTDADELAALVAAEVEYAEAYFGQQAADEAAKNAKTADDNARKALGTAETAVTNALNAVNNPDAHAYIFDPANPAGALTDALLKDDDVGGALVKAIDETWQATQEMGEGGEVDLSGVEGRLDDLVATDEDGMETGRVVDLEDDVTEIKGAVGITDGVHADGCSNNIACNTAEIEHNDTDIETIQAAVGLDSAGGGTVMLPDGTMGSRIDDNAAKLALKKQYIDNLGVEIGFNAATNEGTVMLPDGTMGSRIDDNAAKLALKKQYIDNLGAEIGFNAATNEGTVELADGSMGSMVDKNRESAAAAQLTADNAMTAANNAQTAADNAQTAADNAQSSADDAQSTADGAMSAAGGAQSTADGAMSAASAAQGTADSAVSMARDNTAMIGGLQDQMDIVRAGVAASMALAGMPAVNGRGLAIGVGSFDGESAFAVGFQISGEQASFKVGVTSSGGETGVSAGVGFNF